MRARAAGFDVHIGQAETAPAPSEPYDFVAGWMVLEHLHEPIKVLRQLHAWTRPGATLALSVPDCGAWEMRRFGQYWHSLHIPNHLFHFSRETLAKVLERSGWTLKSVQNQRDLWTAYVSANYLINDESALSKPARFALKAVSTAFLHSKIARPLALAMAAIGQTGCMTVMAERK
jgi:2-polyprenyl-3-methyl-5-hydroxy-6-metoxy-1,4-benzoquinol methylase